MFSPSDPGIYLQSWELVGIPDDGGPRVNLRVQMVGEAAFGATRPVSELQQRSQPQHQERAQQHNFLPQKEHPILGSNNFPEGRRSVAAVAPNNSTKDKHAAKSEGTNQVASSSITTTATASGPPTSVAENVATSSNLAPAKSSKPGGQKKKLLQNVTLKVDVKEW